MLSYSSQTPYNYAFNNPVNLNDPSGADPYSGISRYQADWGQGTIMDYGPLQRFTGSMQYMAGRADLWGGYNGGHWYNFEPWRGPGGGGYGFNADGDYDTGAGYGGFSSGGIWGNSEKVWSRWALRQKNEEVIKYLTDLANGISGEGVYTFGSDAVKTLFGVWQSLGKNEAIFWRFNKAGNAIEFLKPKEPQLLASVGGYIPNSNEEYEPYASMTGVGSFDLREWNLVAYSIGVNISSVVFFGGDMNPISWGKVLKGTDEGKNFLFADGGYGVGLDVAGSIELTFFFYRGDEKEFDISKITGNRWEGNLGTRFSPAIDIGVGIVVGDGLDLIGVKIAVSKGIPTLFSGNINRGETFILGETDLTLHEFIKKHIR